MRKYLDNNKNRRTWSDTIRAVTANRGNIDHTLAEFNKGTTAKVKVNGMNYYIISQWITEHTASLANPYQQCIEG